VLLVAGDKSGQWKQWYRTAIPQAEQSGDVSTQDVLNRFVTALGGTLKLIADFGDEQLKIA
jgi:hypothetical protein